MARLAQRAQVRLVVGATVFERDHVVDLIHGRVPCTGQAVLTQRVGFDVGRADLSPPVVVASVDLRVALVLAVASVLSASVLRAEPLLGQLGTTRVRARALGFERHQTHHPSGKTNDPQTGYRNASGGHCLVVNHLPRYVPNKQKASASADTFWRVGSPAAWTIQRSGQPGQSARLLLVSGGAFDVELLAHQAHRILLRPI